MGFDSTARAVRWLREFAIVVWLFFLYVILIVGVNFTLSSYQAQQSARMAADSTDRFTFYDIIEASFTDRAIERQIAQIEAQIASLSNQRRSIQSQVNALTSAQEEVIDELYSELDPLLETAGVDQEVIFSLTDLSDYQALLDDDFFSSRQGDETIDQAALGEISELFGDIVNQVRDAGLRVGSTLNTQLAERHQSMSEISARISSLSDELGTLANNRFGSQTGSQTELNPTENEAFNDAVNEIISVRHGLCNSLPYITCTNPFTTMDRSSLVIFLTMAMGMLGSTIFITQEYVRAKSNGQDDSSQWSRSYRPISWYIVRPFLGVATAISIYILAKAGQISLTSSSGTQSLDPFFISFLAIISGLLSEQAIQRISRAADPILNNGNSDDSQAANDANSAQPSN
jgi:conjugal transfer/entry exclusion protein